MIVGIPEWNKDSAELLRQFLDTGAGQLFITHLSAARPALLPDSADINHTATRASTVRGFELAVNAVLSLSVPPVAEKTEVENYPNLDDDSKWDAPLTP